MQISNPWVGYLDRSYRAVKASLLNRLLTLVPEITDLSESNILVIVISMFSGLTEQFNYYIDNWAQESYLYTCRLFSSAVQLTRILDYRIKASLPARVDLYFTYTDANGNPVITTEEGIIPQGTNIQTINGVNFITQEDLTVPIGASYGIVSAKQMVRVEDQILGQTTTDASQSFDLPLNYAHGTLEITINGIVWTLQKTLARSISTSLDFIVDVDEDGTPYVKFGNGINGQIPDANFDCVASFYTTDGSSGNTVSPDTVNQLQDNPTLPAPAVSMQITNPLNPIGGADVESIDDIRNNAPLTIRTLDRAVTAQDYTDMALQADSVVKANVINICGKNLEIYIAPAGGGLATQNLIDDTLAYMNTVKMITTHLDVYAAGITPVYVQLLITARFRADLIQCKLDAQNALGSAFSFDSQAINGRVALSDVIALIDNLPKVDTVELQALYTLPYPFPMLSSTIPLDWTRQTNPGSTSINVWRIVYTGTDLRIYFNGAYLANTPINVPYTDPQNILTFRVNPGMYAIGDYWQFSSYPYLKTILMDDNTIPIIIPGQTTNITVVGSTTPSNQILG